MLAGPNEPFTAPKSRPRSRPGHRGQLARLIRERPVFVNVTGRRKEASLKRRNWGEYNCFRGVFDGGERFGAFREPPTLAIRNLTGLGAGPHLPTPKPNKALSCGSN